MPLPAKRFTLPFVLRSTLAAAALFAASQAGAVGQAVDIQVVDRASGQSLPVYSHEGEYWVPGQPGASYAIGVRNLQGQRVLAVMSVDGVNIVTGETASALQDGYVLDPHQYSEITGWRKSLHEVAAFNFTRPGRSYASRTGRPDDIGVIGVAVFREKRPLYVPQSPYSRHAEPSANSSTKQRADSAAAAESAAPVDMAPGLGTGHGRRESSEVTTTRFVRASNTPSEIIRVRYDSLANLKARGIVRQPMPRPGTPQPFPGDTRFVPDPPR